VFSAELAAADASPAALIETIVRRVYEAAEQMPWMPPIWIREVVSEGGTLRDRCCGTFRATPSVRSSTGSPARSAAARFPRASNRVSPSHDRRHRDAAACDARVVVAHTGMADLTNAQLLRHALTVLTAGLTPAKPRSRRKR
jgi:hypothetical protein